MKLSLLLLFLMFNISNLRAEQEIAIFAGGCFWCMQPPFDEAKGVIKTEVGYTGGEKKNATYKKISNSKHLEAIRVFFDNKKTSYKEILKVFWKQIDPTQDDGQFVDKGSQYHSAIFYSNSEQQKLAKKSIAAIEKAKIFGSKKIVTTIQKAKTFYPAEEYHQKYYTKNYSNYKRYKDGSGRSEFIKTHWKNVDLKF